MTRWLLILATLALGSCGQQAQTKGNEVTPTKALQKTAGQCTPPALQLADGGWPFESTLLDETTWNFGIAYQQACKKGLLKDKPLIDPKAADPTKLILINAPEANIASIYLSEAQRNRMVLEYPFVPGDGSEKVPTPEELEEAIYCAVVGATPEEQESTGRCLVD